MIESKWLIFRHERSISGKTALVHIESKSRGDLLGTIQWFGRWRQYTFFPSRDTVFSADCLAAIQAQITEMMNERKGGGSRS